MGITSDDEGESSQQTSNPEDRPMKKARYMWQIKGNYHLKNPGVEEMSRPEMSMLINEPDNNDYTSDQANSICVDNLQEELKKTSIPVSVPQTDKDESVSHTIPTASDDVNPLSNTISNSDLSKWQERSIAKCIVDNTINNVLEILGFIPLPFHVDNISDDNIGWPFNEDDTALEDEAVAMAIHSHGLQNHVSESDDSQGYASHCCNEESSSPSTPCLCKPHPSDIVERHTLNPFHHRPVTCIPMEMDNQLVDDIHLAPSVSGGIRMCDVSPVKTNVYRNEMDIPIVDTKDSVVVSSQNCRDVLTKDLSLPESESDGSRIGLENVDISDNIFTNQVPARCSSPQYDHFDFLDQAVAVAIQKKGLSTLSCSESG